MHSLNQTSNTYTPHTHYQADLQIPDYHSLESKVSRIAGQMTPPRSNRLESRESFGSAFEDGRSVSRDFSVKESPVRGKRIVFKDAGIEVQIGADKEVHVSPVQPTKSSATSSPNHTPPLPPKSLEKSSEEGRETCSCTVS